MTLASMADLLAAATRRGGAVAAFNAIALEHAEGIVRGAELAELPVVLQLSQNTVAYHGSLAPIGQAFLQMAVDARVDVCLHLDHADNDRLVKDAVELGIGSVMIDGSALPYEENVRYTAELTQWCHQQSVWVEAELGEIGGKDGSHAPGARTDPAEAAAFVAATRVDALAVAVGTSHAMQTQNATLDFALIARLADALIVPLVLHGSSGVSDDDLARSVTHGIRKVNIATRLNAAFTGAIRTVLDGRLNVVDSRTYLGAGREAIATEVAHLMRVFDAGRY